MSEPIRQVRDHRPYDHVCGDFKDEFDWASLPLAYRKRVGDPSVR